MRAKYWTVSSILWVFLMKNPLTTCVDAMADATPSCHFEFFSWLIAISSMT